jgi:hypothetical protein
MSVTPTTFHERRAPRRYQLALAVAFGFVLATIVVLLLVHYDVLKGSSSSNGVVGSGVAATQTRSLPPFTSLDLAGSNNISVRVGSKQSVVVHADDNPLRQVTTRVQAGRLVIGNTAGSFSAKSPMSVEVSVPSLEAVTLSGSGIVAITGINAPALTVTVPGSGVLQASGTTARLSVNLGGSGDAQLEQLVARDVHAVVGGSDQIMLTATNSLDAPVTGDGSILYSGNPAHVTTSVTGNGAIVRG